MNRIAFISFFLTYIGNLSTIAQNTWEKFYYDYDNELVNINFANIDIRYDSLNAQYLFLGLSHSLGSNLSVYKIDLFGNLIFRNYYRGSGGLMQNLKFAKNNRVIISDIESISTFVSYKTVYKLDSSLNNIEWKYQYAVRIGSAQCDLLELSNNEIIAAYDAAIGTNTPVLIKTDSTGNLIWTKVFPDLPGLSRSVIETIDHRYLIGVNGQQGSGICLIKTDTSGVALWSKSYLRPEGVIANILEKANGNLLVVGNTGITSQTPYPLMYLMELDSSGNMLWSKTYGDFTYRLVDFDDNNGWNFLPIKIKQTSDGGLILVTTITNQGSNADIILLKTDSTGNIQWEQRRGDSFFSETGLDVIQTPDGGYFVIGGFYRSPDVAGYYLLKTDSLGLIGCGDYSDIIPVNNLFPTDSSIVVTDSVIVINQYIALVHDTTYTPSDSLQGCIIDAVAASNFYGYELSVYPNPSNGIVHVAMNTTEKKNIFVYDLMGREIFRKQNTTESTFDIDLSVNAKGIYLLKVSTSEGSATVKVVLF